MVRAQREVRAHRRRGRSRRHNEGRRLARHPAQRRRHHRGVAVLRDRRRAQRQGRRRPRLVVGEVHAGGDRTQIVGVGRHKDELGPLGHVVVDRFQRERRRARRVARRDRQLDGVRHYLVVRARDRVLREQFVRCANGHPHGLVHRERVVVQPRVHRDHHAVRVLRHRGRIHAHRHRRRLRLVVVERHRRARHRQTRRGPRHRERLVPLRQDVVGRASA